VTKVPSLPYDAVVKALRRAGWVDEFTALL